MQYFKMDLDVLNNPDTDVKTVAHDVLRHRVQVTYEAEAEGKTPDDVIDTILNNVEVP